MGVAYPQERMHDQMKQNQPINYQGAEARQVLICVFAAGIARLYPQILRPPPRLPASLGKNAAQRANDNFYYVM